MAEHPGKQADATFRRFRDYAQQLQRPPLRAEKPRDYNCRFVRARVEKAPITFGSAGSTDKGKGRRGMILDTVEVRSTIFSLSFRETVEFRDEFFILRVALPSI